jgi:hypothetical protein
LKIDAESLNSTLQVTGYDAMNFGAIHEDPLKYHAMKTYGGVEVTTPHIIDGGEWSASRTSL